MTGEPSPLANDAANFGRTEIASTQPAGRYTRRELKQGGPLPQASKTRATHATWRVEDIRALHVKISGGEG